MQLLKWKMPWVGSSLKITNSLLSLAASRESSGDVGELFTLWVPLRVATQLIFLSVQQVDSAHLDAATDDNKMEPINDNDKWQW